MVLGAVLGMAPAQASAQVALSQTSFEAGVNFAAFFKVERGCGASPTTALRVQIPDGVSVLELPEKPGWSVGAERAGGRVTAVTWQGRLESVQPDQFGLLVKLPSRPGPLYFAAVQRCAAQEIRWTDIPAAGVTHPAPMLTLVAAAPDAHAHHASPIVIERPWSRATPPGAQTGVGLSDDREPRHRAGRAGFRIVASGSADRVSRYDDDGRRDENAARDQRRHGPGRRNSRAQARGWLSFDAGRFESAAQVGDYASGDFAIRQGGDH